MMGSTETIFYTLSIYFGAVGIRKMRYTLWGSLLADLAGLLASVIIVPLCLEGKLKSFCKEFVDLSGGLC